jgi:hypothetical protein
MPSLKAFCLSEPSVRFMSLAIFETGVLSFECCFSNFISAFVYGLLGGFLFFALANLFLLETDWFHNRLVPNTAHNRAGSPAAGLSRLDPQRVHHSHR